MPNETENTESKEASSAPDASMENLKAAVAEAAKESLGEERTVPPNESPESVSAEGTSPQPVEGEAPKVPAVEGVGEKPLESLLPPSPVAEADPAITQLASAVGVSVRDLENPVVLKAAASMLAKQMAWMNERQTSTAAAPAVVSPKFDLQKIEETLGPDAALAFKAVNEDLQQRDQKIQQLEQEVSGWKQVQERREVQEQTAYFDRKFSELSADYKEIFGKGDVTEVRSDKKALQHRNELVDMYYALEKGFPGMSSDVLFQRALGAVCGPDVLKNIVRKQLSELSKTNRGMAAARPTNRLSIEPAGDAEEAATRVVAAKLKEMNPW